MALRILLLALTALTMLLAPQPRAQSIFAWPEVVPTLVAPAIAPLILFVLIIDLAMAKILSSGEENAEKLRRARWIMGLDALAIIGLAYTYLPFYLALGR